MKRFILFIIISLALNVYSQQIRISHGPYLQNLNETEVTINWLSDKPSIGWVEIAPDDSTHFYYCERIKYFDTNNGVKKISDLHSVRIKKLRPGTSYRYRVFSQEILNVEGSEIIYGKVASTNVFRKSPLTFTTNDKTKKTTSFAMINDIHGRSADIQKLLDVANYEKKDMIFFNGDMLSNMPDRESVFSGFMDESIRVFASEKPMYYARGNHETRGSFSTYFQDLFSTKQPHLYFMFRQGPICFVVLDTGEDKPDSDIEYCGITDYDSYRTEQSQWLENIIKSDDFINATYRIVIAHMPPLAKKNQQWHGTKEVMNKFVPILNKANIDLMLCGHLHRFLYQNTSSEVKFPVLVNSYNTVVEGELLSDNELVIKLLNIEGYKLKEYKFNK